MIAKVWTTTLTALLAFASVGCGAAPGTTMTPRTASSAAASGVTDVDCDGIADLVGGTMTGDAPAADQPARPGAVYVRYGGSGRIQKIGQDELSDPAPDAGGRFAGTLISADLNRDGCTDIVVSDPTATGGGKVWALWGSATGLSPERAQLLLTGTAGEQPGWVLAFVPEPQPVVVVSTETAPRRSLRLYPVAPDGSLGAGRDLRVPASADRSAWYVDTFADSLSADSDLLVIASPEYSDEGAGYAGEFFVVRMLAGADYRVTRIDQDSPEVPDRHRIHDGFATSVSVRGDRLAVGVPGARDPGAVQLYGISGETPQVSYQRSITAAALGAAGHPVSGDDEFGTTALLYRPCAGADGLVVTDPHRSEAYSVPLEPSASCPARVIAQTGTSPMVATVVRGSGTGTADTAAALLSESRLRLVTDGSASDVTVPFERYFSFATP